MINFPINGMATKIILKIFIIIIKLIEEYKYKKEHNCSRTNPASPVSPVSPVLNSIFSKLMLTP
jgi:hypothetical protein